MVQLIFREKNMRAGFTLLEILIVVSIIGLLAGIGSLSMVKIRERAKIDEANIQLEMISAAALELAWDTGRYPNKARRNTTDSNDEIWDLTEDEAGLLATDGDFTSKWEGPYLDDIPEDPWGNDYFFDPDYKIKGVVHAVIGSFGPNGVGRNKYDDDDIYVIID